MILLREALQSKVMVFLLVLTTVVFALAFFASWSQSDFLVSAIFLIGWVVASTALAMVVSIRGKALAIQRTLKHDGEAQNEKLENLNRQTGVITTMLDTISQRSDDSSLINEKIHGDPIAKKMRQQVNDTAGSVGRMAPLVRELVTAQKEMLSAISGLQNRSNSPSYELDVSSKGSPSKIHKDLGSELKDLDQVPRKIHRDLNVMVIADEFTVEALQYEWNQILPTTKNYRQILDRTDIDLLFIESAWQGNDGNWRYQLVGQSAPRPEIVDLIDECVKRNIPTVLWNKEDPPHFEDFLPLAQLVDYVFTTEVSLIEEYKARLGHEHVYLMPFAAAPHVHNPAMAKGQNRDREIVFGGMYFRDKYPERREQMAYLLPAAAKFKLDIFSRHDASDPKYAFPEDLKQYVRPPLPYSKMLSAYHQYKIVLNVNSVPNSQSMVARRVFEATASGAAVVSPPTDAIENFFSDSFIPTASTEHEAFVKMRALLRSGEYRDRIVHRAQRKIWENHTYRHRIADLLEKIDLDVHSSAPTVSIIVSTNRPENLEILVKNFSRQKYDKKELVIATHGFTVEETAIREFLDFDASVRVFTVSDSNTLGQNLNQLVDESVGSFIVRMDDDDWYGENYTTDVVNAAGFSGADLVGKAATYIYFEASNSTVLTYAASENKYTEFIRGATFAGPRETFERFRFPEQNRSEDSSFLQQVIDAGGHIYSSDRFNFVVRRAAEKHKHTWGVADEELFATGELKFYGDPTVQVDV